jgi:starch phosphorylase
MVRDYTEKYYKKAHRNHKKFTTDNYTAVKELSAWKSIISSKIASVSVKNLYRTEDTEITVGSKVSVRAEISLGQLSPENVIVELYFGGLDQSQEIHEGASLPMKFIESRDSIHVFEGQVLCLRSGEFGYTIRIIPNHPNITRKFDPDLKIIWS